MFAKYLVGLILLDRIDSLIRTQKEDAELLKYRSNVTDNISVGKAFKQLNLSK
jgi:hypothetical protein